MSERVRVRDDVRLAEDRVAGARVLAALAVSAVVTVGCVFWAWLEVRDVRAHAPSGGAPEVILTTPIAADRAGLQNNERARDALDRYAWVDRDRGVARIPIDRAIDIVTRTATEGAR
jgi:hypothetical protein